MLRGNEPYLEALNHMAYEERLNHLAKTRLWQAKRTPLRIRQAKSARMRRYAALVCALLMMAVGGKR